MEAGSCPGTHASVPTRFCYLSTSAFVGLQALESGDSIELGGVEVDVGHARIVGRVASLVLQPRVLDVLVELNRQRGEVVSRELLIERVWNNYPGADQSLTNCVSKLRRAIKEAGGDPRVLRTVPKRGYCLDREECSPGAHAVARRIGTRPLFFAVAAIVMAVALAWMIGRDGQADPPRLGILPMVTVGDPSDLELARGIGQEISTRLASLGSLELVYGGSAASAAEGGDALLRAGAALEADYLLTGSFRRESGDASGSSGYRVAAQLVRVEDGAGIWGEIFEVPAGKLFELEMEIAQAVAAALPGVGTPILPAAPLPTDNELAYRFFLQAIGLSRRSLPTSGQVSDAYFALRRAVELDPEFARAWAELSYVLGLQERWELVEPDIDAGTALARAVELAPNDPDVLIAEAVFRVRQGMAPESAGKAIRASLGALERRPNSARALGALALALRQAGAPDLSVEAAEAALRRAPDDPELLSVAVRAHAAVRHWRRAEALSERMSELEPSTYIHWQGRAWRRFFATGSVAEARGILADAPPGLVPPKVHAEYDFYERDFDAVVARAEPLIERDGMNAFVAGYPVLSLLTGFAYLESGRPDADASLARPIVRLWEGFLEAHPDDPLLLTGLARALMLDGRDAEAIARACQAVWRQSGNHSDYWGSIEILAELAAFSGRRDEAIALLKALLAADYGLTPLNRHALRAHPVWDDLRGTPAFQRLVENAPVSVRWHGEPVPVPILLERAAAVRASPPPELPAVRSLCGDQPSRNGSPGG